MVAEEEYCVVVFFVAEIRDILKKSIEIKQAVQNLISHENEEIKLKSKEVFSCL